MISTELCSLQNSYVEALPWIEKAANYKPGEELSPETVMLALCS